MSDSASQSSSQSDSVPGDEAWLRQRYFSLLKPDDYDGDIGEQDFGYMWSWFQDVAALFRKAAADGRAIVFTVDT